MEPFLLFLNTFAHLKINQYSSGLFVSYFTHGKTQLYKKLIIQLIKDILPSAICLKVVAPN